MRRQPIAHGVHDGVDAGELGVAVFRQGLLYPLATQAGFFGDLGNAFDAAQDAQR